MDELQFERLVVLTGIVPSILGLGLMSAYGNIFQFSVELELLLGSFSIGLTTALLMVLFQYYSVSDLWQKGLKEKSRLFAIGLSLSVIGLMVVQGMVVGWYVRILVPGIPISLIAILFYILLLEVGSVAQVPLDE